MANSITVSALAFLIIMSGLSNVESTSSKYYASSCPQAEQIAAKVVTKAIAANKRVGAGLLRLFFHDCIVEGCDASVLIDSPTDSSEKNAIPNLTLHSLEVIDEIKAQLEEICPKTVSCADIVAFAGTTSVTALGGPKVDIQGGRFDGFVSTIANANAQIPSPFQTLPQLLANFDSKGLSLKDLVVLSGGHTIGVSHCAVVTPRLRNFSSTVEVDPSLDPKLAASLAKKCPVNPSPATVLIMDTKTPTVFDNAYYQLVKANKGLFESDAELYTAGGPTRALVDEFAKGNADFLQEFSWSLFKLGQVGLKTKHNGNIRTNCRSYE